MFGVKVLRDVSENVPQEDFFLSARRSRTGALDAWRDPQRSFILPGPPSLISPWRLQMSPSLCLLPLTNQDRREATVPLRLVPFISHRLSSTFLGIIIVIGCR